jgi:dTDP-4-dehydrorhamnose reductase
VSVRIFVTGLGGYLGHAIAAVASSEVAGTIRAKPAPRGTQAFRIDVRDAPAITDAFAEVRPDAVVHTAFVQQGDDLRSINIEGSVVVASAARAAGLRLVHISSDAIFPGELGRAVREEDPPAPVTAYGASKAEAELAVVAAHPDAVLVRTSLIYGGERPSIHELRALDPASVFYSAGNVVGPRSPSRA